MKDIFLSILRDKNTKKKDFRKATQKLATIIAIEISKKIKKQKIKINTPNAKTTGYKLQKTITLLPILRSGLSLLNPFLYYFEDAKISFLGLKRDEKTFLPNLYYENITSIKKEDTIIILDPMIATGNSALFSIKKLLEKKIKEKNIIFCSIIASKEGFYKIKKKYPSIDLHSTAIDEKLTSRKLISPGLGDFGDRFF
ncbi:MAG: hypothetical protein AMS24_05260 [Chlamydiae bacterium SM23_39]|nr:MAG: hypothetical protein AMS24_05260 [Chlamydiae bacterium SM23_39]